MAQLDLSKTVDAASNRNVSSGADPTGGIFGKITRALKLPEIGISEKIGGQTDSYDTAKAAQNAVNKAPTNKLPTTPSNTGGQVLGTSDYNSGTPYGPALPENKDGGSSGGGGNASGNYWDTGMSNLIKEYAGSAKATSQEAADDLEKTARTNAEREYKDVMKALGGQSKEVGTLASEQKATLAKQQELATTGLEQKKEKDLGSIETQKQDFQKQQVETSDQLGQAWRDMSLEVQKIARASGRDSSSYTAGQEAGVLKDFNSGLRKLSEAGTSAVKSFSDAVIETNQYYAQEKQKIDLEAENANNSIDAWVRGQVSKIQAAQDTALSSKLGQIDSAISKGNQLKLSVANSVASQQLQLGTWLTQMQYNYKAAVAAAATGKVDDAIKTIDYYTKVSTLAYNMLKGGAEVQQGEDGTVSLVGKNPLTGVDYSVDVSEQGMKTLVDQLAAERSKAGNTIAIPSDYSNYSNTQEDLYSQYGIGTNPFNAGEGQ